mmetsp:Transcript_58636/g.124331  ORF Transcript_58636/g.124331 Transcript_58636/m.124331 type:complete len:114 (-) Transcript_58636:169-510(-)
MVRSSARRLEWVEWQVAAHLLLVLPETEPAAEVPRQKVHQQGKQRLQIGKCLRMMTRQHGAPAVQAGKSNLYLLSFELLSNHRRQRCASEETFLLPHFGQSLLSAEYPLHRCR